MNTYLIYWNCGYGENTEEVEANSVEEAQEMAYEAWLQDAESNGEYGVVDSEE